MRAVIFLLAFLVGINLHAQNTLSGTVYLYMEKGNNTPVEGVNVKASGSSQLTKKNGTYFFAFDNQVSAVGLQAMKKGYEVINEEDIRTFQLDKKKLQHIYLDIEGNTRKRERELLDAALLQRLKLRNNYYDILETGGKNAEQLKIKLEKESGKSFANVDELKGYIYDKYGADSKTLESIVPSIIRLNLDHSNMEVEKMKEYALKGLVDSVLFLLDLERGFRDVEDFNTMISYAVGKKKEKKEKIKASMPILISNGLYEKIDSCYRLMTKIDTTDAQIFLDYALFKIERNRGIDYLPNIAADSLLEICSRKPEMNNDLFRSRVLYLQGEAKGTYDGERDIFYYKALSLQRKLYNENPEKYDRELAETLRALSKFSIRHRASDTMDALKEALIFYRKFAVNGNTSDSKTLAEILADMGLRYYLNISSISYMKKITESNLNDDDFAFIRSNTQFAFECYSESIEILRSLNKRKSINPGLLLIKLDVPIKFFTDLGEWKMSLIFYREKMSLIVRYWNEYPELRDNLLRWQEIPSNAVRIARLYKRNSKCDSTRYYFGMAFHYQDSAYKDSEKRIKSYISEGRNKKISSSEWLSILDKRVVKECDIIFNALCVKKYEDALEYSAHAYRIDSSNLQVKVFRAHSLLLTGNIVDAEKIYNCINREKAVSNASKTYYENCLEDLEILECCNAIPKEREVDVKRIKEMLLKKG